tara:strand:+ start:2310 stop:2528 length:219 start_codon:yes stop_codon:yes gene_type:complete
VHRVLQEVEQAQLLRGAAGMMMKSTLAILLSSQRFALRELLLENLRQNADHLSTSACCAVQGIQEPYQGSGN